MDHCHDDEAVAALLSLHNNNNNNVINTMIKHVNNNDEAVAAATVQEAPKAKRGCSNKEEGRGKERKKKATVFSRYVQGIKKVKERTSTIELLCEQNTQQSTVNVSSPRRRVNKRKAIKEELRTTKESN